MKFKEYKLEEIINCFDNKRKPLSSLQRQKIKGIYPYYGAQEIIDYIDRYIFDGKYLILAEDGENLRSNVKPLVKLIDGKFWINNHAHIFQTNEKCKIEYLYYALLKTNIKPFITGTTQPKLNQSNMLKIRVKIPNVYNQNKIVKILETIDRKISNNTQTNNNLLELIDVIYKENISNNNKFKKANEIANITIGKTPPRKIKECFSFNDADIKWLSISDLGKCGMYVWNTNEKLTQKAIDKYNVIIIPENTIVLSFKLTVGRIAITANKMATNEAIAHFNLKDQTMLYYLYCYLKNFDYRKLGSTSSIATAVNSKIIKEMPIGIPNESKLYWFNEKIKPLFEKIKLNESENITLEQLRDTLLPKLMNGEINLDKIEI